MNILGFKIAIVNDWRLIFNKHRQGWAIAFIAISFMNTGIKDVEVDGLLIMFMGIGVRISRNEPKPRNVPA